MIGRKGEHIMSKDWKEEEPSLKEVIENYPELPRLIILKIDLVRRGVTYTEEAIAHTDEKVHMLTPFHTPEGFFLRDGTAVPGAGPGRGSKEERHRDPYIVDYIDGKFVIMDQGEILEEIDLWDKPDYYDKVTSNGTPMKLIAPARAQRLDITPNNKCHFWDKPGNGCKYCSFYVGHAKEQQQEFDKKFYQDIEETIAEAIKEKGRFSGIHMTTGSILDGEELFDEELKLYLNVMKVIGKNFKTEKFPLQLHPTAMNKKQLKRLKEETGGLAYTSDIEVLTEDKFNWICPGKAEFVGYDEWKRRLYDAVEIFGRGYVTTGIVAGVETASPNGFQTEAETLEALLSEADDLASHGVYVVESVWVASPGSIFHKQKTPSLDFFVQLTLGLAKLHEKYGLHVYADDFRRCGMHPNSDFDRIGD